MVVSLISFNVLRKNNACSCFIPGNLLNRVAVYLNTEAEFVKYQNGDEKPVAARTPPMVFFQCRLAAIICLNYDSCDCCD